MEFDFIVVGAGSSGCVLARRLSDNPAHRVLLVEAGGENQSILIKMAAGFAKIVGRPEYFWSFPVLPQQGRRAERHSYGKGLGGSSAVNGMWYLRGNPRDFDGWRELGLPSWGWEHIAQAYREIEDYRDTGAHHSRGQGGPLQITPSTYSSKVFSALSSATDQLGLTWTDDINTPARCGVGRTQYTVDRSGKRASAYEAFVAPVKNRTNLCIVTGCQVKRVLIESGRAVGIECERAVGSLQQVVRYAARSEVIISAGVYKSPQLLMLSGVGPGPQLQQQGIAVVRDLPAVGENFCDHQRLGIAFDLHNDAGLNREFTGWRLGRNAVRYFLTGSGPLARVGLPLTAMVSTHGEPDWPDMLLAASPFAMRTVKEMAAKPGSPISAHPGITFGGFHLRPRGRGHVRLASPDFRDAPVVDSRFWNDPYDQEKALQLLRLLRRWAGARALSRYVGAERSLSVDARSDAALLEELRNLTDPGLHGTGTCAMGASVASSVVDDACRVHGVSGLRVVDCSIVPKPLSAGTNGPAMAIAQRAATLMFKS